MAFQPKRFLACCLMAGFMSGGLSAATASQHGSLQLLRLNLKDQLVQSAKVGGETGCKNFIWARRAYRVVQHGYAYCELYSRRSCRADRAIDVLWLGSHYRPQPDLDPDTPQPRILPGTRWQVATENGDKKNLRVASWRCSYEAD